MKKTLFLIGIFNLCFLFLFGCTSLNKEQKSNSSPPEGMALIPSGTFTMGGRSTQAYADEFPNHEVSISSFYMDSHEVTNEEFESMILLQLNSVKIMDQLS